MPETSAPPLLSLCVWLPLVGAVATWFMRSRQAATATALLFSLLTLGAVLSVVFGFDSNVAGYQYLEQRDWIPQFGLQYKLGVDGISILMVLLTGLLTPIVIGTSWLSISDRTREYMAAMLLLETGMIGVFVALDLVLFYVFWEVVLIPMYLIIGVWGGPRRIYAAVKFFLFTFIGSVLMLVAIIAIGLDAGSFDIQMLPEIGLTQSLQYWVFGAFFAAFAIKIPMFPLHTWLPDAHVEAPTGGSVILAGVLLKMGGYGFLRLILPLSPQAVDEFRVAVIVLSVIAIIYGALVAMAQRDVKKLIAYSSVSHMGFVTLGIFSGNQQALDGAIIQMFSHGLITGALFLCVGVVYDRTHTRLFSDLGGLAERIPVFAVVLGFFTLASLGLPTMSGFVGEFLVLIGAFGYSYVAGFGALVGVILAAAYMLWMYKKLMLGKVNEGFRRHHGHEPRGIRVASATDGDGDVGRNRTGPVRRDALACHRAAGGALDAVRVVRDRPDRPGDDPGRRGQHHTIDVGLLETRQPLGLPGAHVGRCGLCRRDPGWPVAAGIRIDPFRSTGHRPVFGVPAPGATGSRGRSGGTRSGQSAESAIRGLRGHPSLLHDRHDAAGRGKRPCGHVRGPGVDVDPDLCPGCDHALAAALDRGRHQVLHDGRALDRGDGLRSRLAVRSDRRDFVRRDWRQYSRNAKSVRRNSWRSA